MPEVQVQKLPTPYSIIVTEEQEQMNQRLDLAWAELVRKDPKLTKIKGFREKSVTREIAEKHHGRSKLFQNVYNRLAQEGIDYSGLDVVGVRNIEVLRDDRVTPVQLDVVVDLYPQAVPPEVSEIDLSNPQIYQEPVVLDAHIDAYIKDYKDKHATLRTPERVVTQKDDVVLLDMCAYDDDGKEIPQTKLKDHRVTVGAGEIIPELDKLIEGKLLLDHVECKATFPENYNPAFAGRTLDWKFTVKQIYEKTVMSDQQAAEDNGSTTIEEYRKKIREQSEKTQWDSYFERALRLILSELVAKTKFEPIPYTMVEREIDKALANHERRLGRKLKDTETQNLRLMESKPALGKIKERVAARHFDAVYGPLLGTIEELTVSLEEMSALGVWSKSEIQKALEDAYLDQSVFKGLVETMLPREVAKDIWRRGKGVTSGPIQDSSEFSSENTGGEPAS